MNLCNASKSENYLFNISHISSSLLFNRVYDNCLSCLNTQSNEKSYIMAFFYSVENALQENVFSEKAISIVFHYY